MTKLPGDVVRQQLWNVPAGTVTVPSKCHVAVPSNVWNWAPSATGSVIWWTAPLPVATSTSCVVTVTFAFGTPTQYELMTNSLPLWLRTEPVCVPAHCEKSDVVSNVQLWPTTAGKRLAIDVEAA